MPLKILIDAGHGGSETGAVANGYLEKNLNLQVALLLEQELKRCGFETLMTRRNDINMSLSERGQMAINNNCNALISIHFNSFNGTAKGCEIIYSFLKGQTRDSSQWIANCMIDEVVQLGLYRRGVWTKESSSYPGHNYYGVLRSAEPVAGVIAEGLFLDNAEDVKFLKQPDFLKKLAIAYAKGICKAYGIAYVEENNINNGKNYSILQINSRGQEVIELQQKLNQLGYSLDCDGIFGMQTEHAVKDFQATHNLEVDGIVGQKTWEAINNALQPKPTPPPKTENTTTKSWQQLMGEKAIDALAAKGLIQAPNDWKAKDLVNEQTPLWLFFEMLNRITK